MAINKNLFKNMFGSFDDIKDKLNNAIDRKKGETVVNFDNSDTVEKKSSTFESVRLRMHMKKVESILSFEYRDEFTQRLEQCFDEWVKYKCSLEQFQRNDYIRKAYYGDEKIYDLITKINENIVLLEKSENADVVKSVVYHNYIKNLKIHINEMINKNSKVKSQLPYKIDENCKKVVLFITDECSDIEPIKCLFQAYKIGKKLNDKDVFSDEDFEECRQMNMLMNKFSQSCSDLSGLIKLEERLKQKNASNIAVNESNCRLYNKLTEVFTEEWFLLADCTKENSKVNLCHPENLKEFYEDYMAGANKIIAEYKKN